MDSYRYALGPLSLRTPFNSIEWIHGLSAVELGGNWRLVLSIPLNGFLPPHTDLKMLERKLIFQFH
jgi:hypothetical protein